MSEETKVRGAASVTPDTEGCYIAHVYVNACSGPELGKLRAAVYHRMRLLSFFSRYERKGDGSHEYGLDLLCPSEEHARSFVEHARRMFADLVVLA